ncbi:AAA family ATPase [Vibrio cholerae]|uniref:AAA family ATPase n=1 Tax=Vibrio cholerae TaxID=666 RepID=UPI003080A3BE
MLAKFSVKNFRNFQDWLHFNFETDRNYEFNTDNISDNGIIRHSMIYGVNGSGKTNLGLAILDVTCHIKDISLVNNLKANYLNGSESSEDSAHFRYLFKFESDTVVYEYRKIQPLTTEYEKLEINGRTVLEFDRNNGAQLEVSLAGTESLKTDLSSSPISAVKYVNSNSVLSEDNKEASLFIKFIHFISGMVFFRTLTKSADYYGTTLESTISMSDEIIALGKLPDFQNFLNNSGVKCKLVEIQQNDSKRIAFDYGDKKVEFTLAASTGTISLGVFYYWWMKIEQGQLNFVYIDEFDAYYHHNLAKSIVKRMSETNNQTVLTTHNISLLSNDLLRPDSYFILHKNVQYPFYKLVDKELRKAHNLEKIYKGLDYEF